MSEGVVPRLLLTNDDGIDAPGLRALHTAALRLGEPFVVAPTACHSGCGHRVTTHEPLFVNEIGPGRVSVTGTPADCVRLALHHLALKPAWVLSGINAGGNLGADVWHSGTVAAVREAVAHGVPGVAVSHYIRRGVPLDWERAARLIEPVLRRLLDEPWQPATFWNVNLPHLDPDAPDPETIFCPLDVSPLPVSYQESESGLLYCGNYHQRPRQPGGDVEVCFSGKIAVSRLSLG